MTLASISTSRILRVLHALHLRRKHAEINTVLSHFKGHSFLGENIQRAQFIPFNTSTGQDPQILFYNRNSALIKTPPVDTSRKVPLSHGVFLTPNVPHPFSTLSRLTLRMRLELKFGEKTTYLQINFPLLATEKSGRITRITTPYLPRKLELWAFPAMLEVRYPRYAHDPLTHPLLRYDWLANASTALLHARFTPYGMSLHLELPRVLSLLVQLKPTLNYCLQIDPTLSFHTEPPSDMDYAPAASTPHFLPAQAPLSHRFAPLAILMGTTVKTHLTDIPAATTVFKTNLRHRSNEWHLDAPAFLANPHTTHNLDNDFFAEALSDCPSKPLFEQTVAQNIPATVHNHLLNLPIHGIC